MEKALLIIIILGLILVLFIKCISLSTDLADYQKQDNLKNYCVDRGFTTYMIVRDDTDSITLACTH